MARRQWQKTARTPTRIRTAMPVHVFGVAHDFRPDQAHQAEPLIDAVAARIAGTTTGRKKPTIAVELTERDYRRIQDSPDFRTLRKELSGLGQGWREMYFRFWHTVIHGGRRLDGSHFKGLNSCAKLLPIDHARWQEIQDANFKEHRDVAYRYFLKRNRYMARRIMDLRPAAALLGRSHIEYGDYTMPLMERLAHREDMKFAEFRPNDKLGIWQLNRVGPKMAERKRLRQAIYRKKNR